MQRIVYFSINTLILASLLLLVSCASKETAPAKQAKQPAAIQLHSITVLPVGIEKSDQDNYTTSRQLEAGADILTALLEDTLSDTSGTYFLSPTSRESLLGDFTGNPKAAARHIGQQLGSDAVLLTTLNRFTERDGGEYSVKEPASVAFKYHLIHVETGKTLCMGVFDETQQTLLSNLFSYSKASSRGFKWITADKLAQEGLEEKFKECQYLSK